jgi:hypothetical protein
LENVKGGDHFAYPDVNGKIILKLALRNRVECVDCPRIGSSGGLL